MATEKDLIGGADKEELVGGKVADKEEEEEEKRIVHLDDNVLAKIVAVHLPSMAAYRCRAVAKAWSGYTKEPTFLKHHLALRPLKLDETPAAHLLQPRAHARLGYVHALVVGLHDDAKAFVDFPLHPEFENLAAAPAPAPTTPEPAVPVPDYIAFFADAARRLDLSIVGSHGRLLLARSGSGYVVGFPERNRFVNLLPPPSTPNQDHATSLQYELLDAGGGISFRVLVLRADGGNITVDTFSSASGRWESRELGVRKEEAFLFVRPESRGISTGPRHYWLDGQRRGLVLVYDEASGTASVLREPPTKQGWKRLGRALGSVDLGTKLRFSAFDSFDPEENNPQPHALTGTHTMWTLNAAGAWEQELHQTRDVSAHCYSVPYGAEIPVDFAGLPHPPPSPLRMAFCYTVISQVTRPRRSSSSAWACQAGFTSSIGTSVTSSRSSCDVIQ
ncbi:hypothetical protein QOZ80_7BG0606520 [Eleusine coracana subsp. coracana]|nr:hypothetical protein QOZ80_7BG0606520 [Eleusine coracana subsp. coracana]